MSKDDVLPKGWIDGFRQDGEYVLLGEDLAGRQRHRRRDQVPDRPDRKTNARRGRYPVPGRGACPEALRAGREIVLRYSLLEHPLCSMP